MNRGSRLTADTRGGGLVEYVIVVGVVVLLSIQAFATFGDQVGRTMTNQGIDKAKMGF